MAHTAPDSRYASASASAIAPLFCSPARHDVITSMIGDEMNTVISEYTMLVSGM